MNGGLAFISLAKLMKGQKGKITQNQQFWWFHGSTRDFLALNLCGSNYACACRQDLEGFERLYFELCVQETVSFFLSLVSTHLGLDIQKQNGGYFFLEWPRTVKQYWDERVSSAIEFL